MQRTYKSGRGQILFLSTVDSLKLVNCIWQFKNPIKDNLQWFNSLKYTLQHNTSSSPCCLTGCLPHSSILFFPDFFFGLSLTDAVQLCLPWKKAGSQAMKDNCTTCYLSADIENENQTNCFDITNWHPVGKTTAWVKPFVKFHQTRCG